MSYTTFVITGLIGATAMTTATSEATVNAFIQYKIEKTFIAVAPISPVMTKVVYDIPLILVR